MLENDEHKEKKNFTESEIEVLLAEVEVRAGTLFGVSPVLSHKTKCVAWQCIAQAVNEVGGAAKVPKRRKKMVWLEITVQKTRCLLIARFAIS